MADADVTAVVAALQKKVTNDFRPVCATDAALSTTPKGTQPSSGPGWLVLLDDSDQVNGPGYHDLRSHYGRASHRKSVRRQRSESRCLVDGTASHELLEMFGDPNLNLGVFVQNHNNAENLYAYEVCDACEDDSYGYCIDNILVSDFVYPAWFESFHTGSSTQFDRMNKIQNPLPLLAGGYMGTFNVTSGKRLAETTAEKHPPISATGARLAPAASAATLRAACGSTAWRSAGS